MFNMPDKIYKVAVVGCGAISENHILAILECEDVEIVALCDIKTECAEAKKQKHNLICKVYNNFNEMLTQETLDAIHIATPHYLHAEMAIKALELNVNVFLEKPICINLEQISAMLEAEKKSRAKICVCFQNRFNPSTIKAKEITEADGGVTSAYGSIFWERNVPYYTESDWRGKYASEGGGVMINQAIHTIDLLCYYLGTPKSIIATKANHHLKGVIEVEDTCEGIINFDAGKRANFYATTSFHSYNSTTVFLKTRNHIIEVRNGHLYVDYEKCDSDANDNKIIGKSCYGGSHFILIKKFYSALRSGASMPVTLESAQWALRILLAAYKSNDEEIKI